MDAKFFIESAFAVSTFFAAFWMRQIRQDVHELVKAVANHGERIAVLESRVNRLDK